MFYKNDMGNSEINKINEIIVLSHLQNLYESNLNKSIYHFSGSPKRFKKNSKKYVKIDSKKIQELENKFLTYKLKAVFSNKIKIDKTKIYEINNDFIRKIIIYENNYINKLYVFDDFYESIYKINSTSHSSLTE